MTTRSLIARAQAAGAALLLALALVSPITASAAALRRGNGSEPESLDPHKTYSAAAFNVIVDLFEGLTTFDAKARPQPGVAASMTVSPDGRVYEFTLRPDAVWADGRPVTGDDFVYAFRRMLDPATASEYANVFAPLVGADAILSGAVKDLSTLGVTAPDPRHVVIRLAKAMPYLPSFLAMPFAMPLRRDVIEAHGATWTRPETMMTNGPYRLESWVQQSAITLTRNPRFRDAANVALDKVVYTTSENRAEEIKRFRAGEIDITDEVPSDQVALVKATAPEAIHTETLLSSVFLFVNMTRAPLGDHPGLRRALALAIDREKLAQAVGSALMTASYGFVPPGIEGYASPEADFARLDQAARETEARRLMAEAGYGPGHPLKVDLLYTTDPNDKRLLLGLSAMWRKTLGVETNLINQDYKSNAAALAQHTFEIAHFWWIADYPDPTTFLDLMRRDAGPRNGSAYAEPAYDALLDRATAATDPAARAALLAQAEAQALRDLPIIPIVRFGRMRLLAPRVTGYEANPLGMHPTRWIAFKP